MNIPYQDVVVINSDRKALELSIKLRDMPREQQRPFFGGTPKTGFFYLFTHESVPDMVLESVHSTDVVDGITAIYKPHPIFASPGELIRAREVLIETLAKKVGLPAESVGIDDPVRGRALGLNELSTGQLIDMLAEQEGSIVMKTDSYVGGAADLTGSTDIGEKPFSV